MAVDIADTQLLGAATERYKDRIDLCVDHHPSNSRYAANLLLDVKAAATVEVIYAVITGMGAEITPRIAACLYTGLATDTGCFRYSNVTSAAHILAAKLIDKGIDMLFHQQADV